MLEPERYVINFGDRTEVEAQAWPALYRILEADVWPQRARDKRAAYRNRWWLFAERRVGLQAALAHIGRCMASSKHAKHLLVAFLPSDLVFSHAVSVFALDERDEFSVLQSRTHEVWARRFGSTMKTDLRYTAPTCFETFPFPGPTPEQRAEMAAAGEALYAHRSHIMQTHQIGMTETWNRLLDPRNRDPDILELRRLRDAMDAAVLAAYGWSDLDPDDRDTIVRRLRRLNAERAAEEEAAAADSRRARR